MKTIIVHKPKRCRNPRIEVFDDHIDKVNNVRSKKYIPEGTDILQMGMGGENLFNTYIKKYKIDEKDKLFVKYLLPKKGETIESYNRKILEIV